jgi:SAM-dependent methyltransferase
MQWVGAKVAEHGLAERSTLELGALDVNGSVRGLFSGPYVGIDMRPGPGVDLVCRADSLPYRAGSFDVVVSTEMLEHDPYFWRTLPEARRVLRKGGHLLVTARGIGFPLHDYPSDFWRFTTDALEHLFAFAGLETVEVCGDPGASGVFGLARK